MKPDSSDQSDLRIPQRCGIKQTMKNEHAKKKNLQKHMKIHPSII